MKNMQVLLLGLLFIATTARAQTSSSDTVSNQVPQSSATSTRPNDYGAGGSSYGSHTSYDGMGSLGVPQYKAEPTDLSYIGVLGEKWETDKRGRRSSFIHQGIEMSISRGLQSSSAKSRTDTIPERKRDPLAPVCHPPKNR